MGDASRLMTSTCELIRVTQTVDDGDITETEADPVSTKCAIFPKSTSEDGGRVVVETQKWDAFFPADLDLNGVDRIRFNGDEFELDGDPTTWPAVRSMKAYTQANLVRTA